MTDYFAVAKFFAALHNASAFQASSPKTFPGRPIWSAYFLFFATTRSFTTPS
jgi:hypothetical protein